MGGYSQRFSRRAFVAGTSSFAALHSMANLLPLPPLIAALQNDSRLSQTVVSDKGFASQIRVLQSRAYVGARRNLACCFTFSRFLHS
jgi:hypothetical protein